jgi:hypothetical protein
VAESRRRGRLSRTAQALQRFRVRVRFLRDGHAETGARRALHDGMHRADVE